MSQWALVGGLLVPGGFSLIIIAICLFRLHYSSENGDPATAWPVRPLVGRNPMTSKYERASRVQTLLCTMLLLCLSSVCGYLVILRPDNGFFRMAFVLVNSVHSTFFFFLHCVIPPDTRKAVAHIVASCRFRVTMFLAPFYPSVFSNKPNHYSQTNERRPNEIPVILITPPEKVDIQFTLKKRERHDDSLLKWKRPGAIRFPVILKSNKGHDNNPVFNWERPEPIRYPVIPQNKEEVQDLTWEKPESVQFPVIPSGCEDTPHLEWYRPEPIQFPVISSSNNGSRDVNWNRPESILFPVITSSNNDSPHLNWNRPEPIQFPVISSGNHDSQNSDWDRPKPIQFPFLSTCKHDSPKLEWDWPEPIKFPLISSTIDHIDGNRDLNSIISEPTQSPVIHPSIENVPDLDRDKLELIPLPDNLSSNDGYLDLNWDRPEPIRFPIDQSGEDIPLIKERSGPIWFSRTKRSTPVIQTTPSEKSDAQFKLTKTANDDGQHPNWKRSGPIRFPVINPSDKAKSCPERQSTRPRIYVQPMDTENNKLFIKSDRKFPCATQWQENLENELVIYDLNEQFDETSL